MNVLTMTPEQYEAHQLRVKGARIVRFEGNETGQEIAQKGKQRQKPPKISVPKLTTEDIFAAQLEQAGLKLERQYRWLPGRKYRADFADVRSRLLVELDGGVHRIRAAFDADILKSQNALLAGWRLLRIGKKQVLDGSAADIVRRAIDMVVPF